MPTAQKIYQTSIRQLFSTFLERFSVKPDNKQQAEELLLDYSLWQKADAAWSHFGFNHFLAQNKNLAEINADAVRLVRQFVHHSNINQAKIFLHGFLLALKTEGCSDSTIRNYRSDINQFIEFSADTELASLLIKPKIESFARYQEQKGLKRSSIQRKLASITQFANWATVHDLVVDHPLGQEHTHMALSQAEKLFEAIQKQKSGPTQPAAISRLYRPSASRESYLKTLTQKTKSSFLPYLNFGLLILFILGFSWITYVQFYSQVDQPLAFPSEPTRPNRVLSFQGRLTDTAQNPITVSTNFRFRIFDAVTLGNELWDSGTCAIDPDQDGIFSTTLGDDCGTEIPEDVFSENAATWLQVEVASETLTPRQPIGTVPYALNAETLQGFPISATEAATRDTVVVMNSSGDIVLGENSPGIRSVSGNFSIEGQSLTLQTTAGSDGDIVLSPDGLGTVIAEKYLFAPGATLSATYAEGVPLTLRGGPSGTANITEWQNSAGSVLSVIDEAGFLGIGTNNPAAGIEALLTTEQLRLSYDGSNRATFTVSSSGDLTIAPTGDDLTIAGDLIVGNSGTTTFNTVEYTWPGGDGTAGYVLSTDGAGVLSWVDNGSGGSSLWANTLNVYHPIDEFASIVDLVIGGTSTASADIQLFANGAAVFNEQGNDADFRIEGVGDANTFFVDASANRVGIGTNTPSNKFDILTGATTNSGFHLGEVLNEGGYLTSTVDSRLLLTGGWELVGGTNTARSTVASGIDLTTGTIQFFTDSSLTDGNSFTPTERMRILSNGNVGIGDTNPDAFLDITGTTTQLRLSFETGDTNFVNFTVDSGGDLNINPTGGQVVLNNGDTLNIGGVTGLGYNAISDAGTTSHGLASDDDLYIEGDLEVDGTGFFDGNITVVGTTTFNTVTYTWPGADGTSGFVLSTDGAGTLSWEDPAGAAASAIFWEQTNGALYPKNSTVDFLVGGQASSSAKFAVLNVNDGTPTASVSAGTAGAAYLTATGNLATTANQSLTLGGSTTGNIITQEHILAGTDNSLDLGATSSARFRSLFLGPDALHIQCTTGDGCGQDLDYQLGVDPTNNVLGININSETIGDNVALAITESGNIGLGTVAPAAKLDSLATTEQLRLSYDASNFTQFVVGATGDIDITPSGGDFTISGDLIVDGGTTTFNTIEYTWPGADGTSGFVLSTDGAGNLTWVDNGAGGSSLWANTLNVYHPIDEFASVVDLVIGGTSTASADIQLFANGAAVFNEQGNDADFRVEGTGDANALFVDASTDRVGIRTNTPQSVLEVGGSTSTITNTSGDITIDATSNNISLNGDNLINFAQLQGNDGVVGAPTFGFQNETDTGFYRVTTDTIGFATGGVLRATVNATGQLALLQDGSTAGLAIGAGGDLTAYHDGTDSFIVNATGDLVINGAAGSEVVFNESGLDIDFRIEGDNDTTLFALDASADKIGFGLANPTAKFHFQGAAVGKALAIFNETGNQNILVASSSGVTRFVVENDGDIIAQRLLDLSNNAFLVDPAASGTSANFAGDITLDAGGTIESTGNNNIDIDAGSGTVSIGGGTGKFDAGTIDPPYWIDGVGYATYMPSMIGVKEEITKLVNLKPTNTPGLYKYEISFDNLTKGTDLWLFSRIIDLDPAMSNLVVLLSAQNDSQVTYRKDLAQRKLIIFGNKPTEVSMRLTAPRFDHQKWGVIRENQDGRGFKPGSYKLNNNPDGSSNISDNDLVAQLTGTTEFTLTSLGQLQIQGAETNQAQLVKNGSVWQNLGAFSSAVIANLQAGVVNTGRLAANIKITSPKVETDLISPLSGSDVTVKLGESQGQTGKLNVKNAQNQTVASVDGTGNANFAGDLTAKTVTANNVDATSSRFQQLEANVAELKAIRAETAELVTATVSGTLYTDTIAARVIEGFDDKVATALQQPSLLQQLLDQQSDLPEISSLSSLYQITDTDPLSASGAGSLNKSLADLSLDQTDLSIGAEAVFVNQYFEVNGTGYISDSLGIGNSLLVGDGMVLADGLIEYKATAENPSPILEIQPSGIGSLSLLAGLMTLDESGQVQINGDLAVSGSVKIENTLLTDLIQPTDFGNPFQVQVAGVATESGQLQESRFEIVNELGNPVATISAQGRAEFAGGLGVGAEDLSATNSAEVTAQKTSGRAVIKPNTTQTTIYSAAITANSLIQVTPLGSTNNQVLYVKAQTADNKLTPANEGSFVVGFDSLTFDQVPFTWWIIN